MKKLLCRIFGHKWKLTQTGRNIFQEEIVTVRDCTRCGAHRFEVEWMKYDEIGFPVYPVRVK